MTLKKIHTNLFYQLHRIRTYCLIQILVSGFSSRIIEFFLYKVN